MLGLNNVDNTTEVLKPVSNAIRTALDVNVPLDNPTFTGAASGINEDMVGLNNVDNTTDLLEPEGCLCIVRAGSHHVGPPHCLMTARKGTLAQAGVRWRLRTQRLAQAGDRASNTGCCQQAWDAGAVCGSDR